MTNKLTRIQYITAKLAVFTVFITLTVLCIKTSHDTLGTIFITAPWLVDSWWLIPSRMRDASNVRPTLAVFSFIPIVNLAATILLLTEQSVTFPPKKPSGIFAQPYGGQ